MSSTSAFLMHWIRLLNKRMQRGRHRRGCSGSRGRVVKARNPLGSPRAGSNPADYVDYCIWRVARDCRLSQGAPLSQVRSRFQIPLLTGVSSPVVRAPRSFEKELVKSSPPATAGICEGRLLHTGGYKGTWPRVRIDLTTFRL